MNVCKVKKKIFALIEGIEVPIFIAFFTLAGAGLQVNRLAHVGVFGLLYFLGLVLGKNTGSFIGGKLVHAPLVVQRYLGLGLIPQAGVVIGLMILASQQYPQHAHFFTNVILASVVLGEVIGPICTRWALTKAGEINILEEGE